MTIIANIEEVSIINAIDFNSQINVALRSAASDWRFAIGEVNWDDIDLFNLYLSIPRTATTSWSFDLPSNAGPITLTVKGKGLAINEGLVNFFAIVGGNYDSISRAAFGTVKTLSLTKDGVKIAPDISLKDVAFGNASNNSNSLLKVIIEDLTDDDKAIEESTIDYFLDNIDTDPKSSTSTRLTDTQFNLTLTGRKNINGFGNKYDNVIIGNSKANKLRGYVGADTLVGNGGADVITGDQGDDTIYGGGGKDKMNGGIGQDTFVYMNLSDSKVDKEDIIIRFNGRAGDRIDLSSIDANSDTPEKESLRWRGKKQFSGLAGEVRFNAGILEVNTDSDLDAEMAIILRGVNLFRKEYLILAGK